MPTLDKQKLLDCLEERVETTHGIRDLVAEPEHRAHWSGRIAECLEVIAAIESGEFDAETAPLRPEKRDV